MSNQSTQEVVDNLTVFDDTFFHKLVEDIGFCEELVQVVLDNKKIHVVEATPQKSLRNVKGRSVVLDAYCVDESSANYDIEMQRKDEKDPLRRMRYNTSNMDTYATEKGTKFENLPELYAIYISLNDFYEIGKPIFHVISIVKETGEQIDNGVHEIFVNAEIDDGSELAELMQIFKTKEVVKNVKFPRTSGAIENLKVGKGRGQMCELVENYAKEVAKEAAKESSKQFAKRLFLNGAKFYMVSQSTDDLTEDELREIQKEAQNELKSKKHKCEIE